MRHAALLLAAAGLAAGAAALSRGVGPGGTPPVQVRVESRNPWSILPDRDPAANAFHFAVIGDRTGGHRKGVFSRAVEKINLLRPAFVVSVGDLIEGSANADTNRRQWAEFNGYLGKLTVPFFYAPGNHDAANTALAATWQEQFGRRYYHFRYRDVLFLVLNAYDDEDQPAPASGKLGTRFGPKQRDAVKAALAANADARWTFVFLHPPVWADAKAATDTGFAAIEDLLAGRPYTVFAGHLHQYRKYLRRGHDYFQLATTGGGSSLRGVEYGEFDQVAWVTVGPDRPVVANVLIDAVLREDLAEVTSDEGGNDPLARAKRVPVTGTLHVDGAPPVGAAVNFYIDPLPGVVKMTLAGNGRVMPDGTFTAHSQRGPVGLVPITYRVTVGPAEPIVMTGPGGDGGVPARYRDPNTTPLRATVTADRPNVFRFDLTTAPGG
jgi:hypothetical protein